MNVRANNLTAGAHRPRFQYNGLNVRHVESGLMVPAYRLRFAPSMARAFEDMGQWVNDMANDMLLQCCELCDDVPPHKQYLELKDVGLRYRRLANFLHELGI